MKQEELVVLQELQLRGLPEPERRWSRRRRVFVWTAALFGLVGAVLIVAIQRDRQADDLRVLIRSAASRHRLDPAFVEAVVIAESSGNPTAVSSAGAVGLMQLMIPTATEMAGRPRDEPLSRDELFDSELNLDLGCRYLHYLGKLFHGDRKLVLMAYNAGQGRVRKWQRKTTDPDEMLRRFAPSETRAYVARVLEFWETIKAEE